HLPEYEPGALRRGPRGNGESQEIRRGHDDERIGLVLSEDRKNRVARGEQRRRRARGPELDGRRGVVKGRLDQEHGAVEDGAARDRAEVDGTRRRERERKRRHELRPRGDGRPDEARRERERDARLEAFAFAPRERGALAAHAPAPWATHAPATGKGRLAT